jgi:hypothetical protein
MIMPQRVGGCYPLKRGLDMLPQYDILLLFSKDSDFILGSSDELTIF